MATTISNITGNVQVIEQGGGVQINSRQDQSSDSELIKEFTLFLESNSDRCGDISEAAKNSVNKVLSELENEGKTNPAKVKVDGTEKWLKRIQTSLSCMVSVSTLVSAPWWSTLKDIITNFVNNL